MPAATPRVIFICKARIQDYGQGSSSGVSNAAAMTAAELEQCGLAVAKAVTVVDGNGIEAAVVAFQATVVVIEALWATPAKMVQLATLHPGIQWYVRVHSKTPFLAAEGFAVGWLVELAAAARTMPNLHIGANSHGVADDLSTTLGATVEYLPVIYQVPALLPAPLSGPGTLDIGCFGALRPLKNHLEQAVAAIVYATDRRLALRFHINATPDDVATSPIYRNLAALFAAQAPRGLSLVVHPWCPHSAFLSLVRSMDIAMQVSFSESFNIVAADAVSQSVPVVVGTDIEWLPDGARVSPTAPSAIIRGLVSAMAEGRAKAADRNRLALARYVHQARIAWSVVLVPA